jgi:Xaa-Pro aminopeptidase
MRVAPVEAFAGRIARLRQELAGATLDALVVTSLPNVAYLSGFFASAAALVVTTDRLALIGDGRYAETLAARARACAFVESIVIPPGVSYEDALVDVLSPFQGLRVGFEAAYLTVSRHRYLSERLTHRGWKAALVESVGLVERLRVRKDPWEIARLRDGAERLSAVTKCILPRIFAGRTEAEVAAELDSRLRSAGFERPAFDTIVASGPHSALPHARATARRIEEGDLVVVDVGGVLDGYCTDMTRTVTVGRAGERERRVIAQVAEAQAAAFAAVRPGGRPEAVDAAARHTLNDFGVGEAFSHGTGHGLGLEVHEAPRVTRARPGHDEPPLAAGMVLTIEPGVYFPGWGGARIEDDVLITDAGAEWLTDRRDP